MQIHARRQRRRNELPGADVVQVLLVHVLDHYVADDAQLAGIADRLAGIINMHMNLDGGLPIAGDNRRIAHRLDGRTDFLHIKVLAGQEKLHIVRVPELCGAHHRGGTAG